MNCENGSLLTGEEFHSIVAVIEVLFHVSAASEQLEASKLSTISRCAPKHFSPLEVLYEYYCSHDTLEIARSAAKLLLKVGSVRRLVCPLTGGHMGQKRSIETSCLRRK